MKQLKYITILTASILVICIIAYWIIQFFFGLDNESLTGIDVKNSDLLAHQIKRFDWLLAIFGTFMTLIILSFTIVSFLQQKQHNRETKALFEKEIMLFTKEFDVERVKVDFNKQVPVLVDKHVNKLFSKFEKRYRKEIYLNTKRYTEEALLIIPQYQDRVTSRIRSSINVVKSHFETSGLDQNTINPIIDELHRLNTNLHALSRLFNTEKDQKMSGLRDIVAVPFLEIEPYLRVMKGLYEDDPDIGPLIYDALSAIAKYQSKKHDPE